MHHHSLTTYVRVNEVISCQPNPPGATIRLRSLAIQQHNNNHNNNNDNTTHHHRQHNNERTNER